VRAAGAGVAAGGRRTPEAEYNPRTHAQVASGKENADRLRKEEARLSRMESRLGSLQDDFQSTASTANGFMRMFGFGKDAGGGGKGKEAGTGSTGARVGSSSGRGGSGLTGSAGRRLSLDEDEKKEQEKVGHSPGSMVS
jgi:hypothetical protein